MNETEINYISLSEAAKLTNYSQDYISLLCRQRKIKGVKMGRNWVTTKEWIREYIDKTKGKGEIVIPVKIKAKDHTFFSPPDCPKIQKSKLCHSEHQRGICSLSHFYKFRFLARARNDNSWTASEKKTYRAFSPQSLRQETAAGRKSTKRLHSPEDSETMEPASDRTNLLHASLDLKKVIRQDLRKVLEKYDFAEARRVAE